MYIEFGISPVLQYLAHFMSGRKAIELLAALQEFYLHALSQPRSHDDFAAAALQHSPTSVGHLVQISLFPCSPRTMLLLPSPKVSRNLNAACNRPGHLLEWNADREGHTVMQSCHGCLQVEVSTD